MFSIIFVTSETEWSENNIKPVATEDYHATYYHPVCKTWLFLKTL